MKRILAAVVLAAAAFACWADTVSVQALGTSLPLSAGPGAKVTLVPTGGTARVEYTFNNSAAISNGTAIWNAWPSGNVSASTNDTAAFQMFVRAVGVTGAASLTVDAADPNTVLYVSSRPWSSQLFGEPVILCKSGVAVSAAANDTTENVLATCSLPAGAMGSNGAVRITLVWTTTNSANAKTARVRLSGASGTDFLGNAFTNVASITHQVYIANRNATNSQIGTRSSISTGSAALVGAHVTGTVDTTPSTSLVISCQKATGSETCTLESYLVELLPSP